MDHGVRLWLFIMLTIGINMKWAYYELLEGETRGLKRKANGVNFKTWIGRKK